ncbi:MAG: 50S ribosomal protein L17 [Clostridia bacterium]|nr:50S ribosomal protein L17 [Clostridia bacterium]
MKVKKLNRPGKERRALSRNQATDLFMHGKIETTVAKAKYLKSYAEKILTLAIKTFDKVVTITKNYVDEKGNKTTREVINDAPEKLNARRAIKAKLYSAQEPRKEGEKKADYIARLDNIKDPLLEKIFNVYAPKYAERARDLKQGGGYTRIIKTGKRRGDNADMAIIELI